MTDTDPTYASSGVTEFDTPAIAIAAVGHDIATRLDRLTATLEAFAKDAPGHCTHCCPYQMPGHG